MLPTPPLSLLQRPQVTGDEAKLIICHVARLFYGLGWVTGTGGGLSIRSGEHIYMAPSGVQKEFLSPELIYTLDANGAVIDGPPAERGLRVSQCRPLFMHCYRRRQAGAVLHSHSLQAMLATLLFETTFTCSHLEMQKGLRGNGYLDHVQVPIIDNTPHEEDLSEALDEAIAAAPASCHAILVRRHGVYVWGDTWIDAKRHVECYDYLFQATVEMHRLGLNRPAEILS